MAKFARVTFAEIDPARVEDGIAEIKEIVIPRTRVFPGFQGGYWLGDREAGKVIGVTMFDSEESLRETDEAAAQIRQQAGSDIEVTFTAIESYEVIAEV